MVVIKFDNVSKHFNIYQNKVYSIKESFMNKLLKRDKLEVVKVNVLSDASFEIQKGETVGIIGENGTGKSTTLKLVSKILLPNKGSISVKGKISSLLEVGIGFQPDMTGKENVYLYGSILGLSKVEVESKYDDIVDFAELRQFMDTPVKNYSSGMYMRLAFSVAVSVNPDILLVDEVLAVGDANFQKKCLNKITSFKNEGKTILFVSHDMSTVRKICDRVLFIKRGGYVIEGTPEQMIGLYLKLVYSNDEGKEVINQSIEQRKKIELESNFKLDMHEAKEFSSKGREGNMDLEITKLYFSDYQGRIQNIFNTGEDIRINVEFKQNRHVSSAIFAIKVYTEEGWFLSYHNCKQDGIIMTDLKDTNMISVAIKNNSFLKSRYYLSAILSDEESEIIYDSREKHYWFSIVEENATEHGKIKIDCDWQI
jgi:ABC-2 type transport system ATP-binding protein